MKYRVDLVFMSLCIFLGIKKRGVPAKYICHRFHVLKFTQKCEAQKSRPFHHIFFVSKWSNGAVLRVQGTNKCESRVENPVQCRKKGPGSPRDVTFLLLLLNINYVIIIKYVIIQLSDCVDNVSEWRGKKNILKISENIFFLSKSCV